MPKKENSSKWCSGILSPTLAESRPSGPYAFHALAAVLLYNDGIIELICIESFTKQMCCAQKEGVFPGQDVAQGACSLVLPWPSFTVLGADLKMLKFGLQTTKHAVLIVILAEIGPSHYITKDVVRKKCATLGWPLFFSGAVSSMTMRLLRVLAPPCNGVAKAWTCLRACLALRCLNSSHRHRRSHPFILLPPHILTTGTDGAHSAA